MYPVHNRKSLTVPIEIELAQKEKTLSHFFSSFPKSTLNFEYYETEDDPHIFCISKLRTRKTWIDKCLKRTVSEYKSKGNMANGP